MPTGLSAGREAGGVHPGHRGCIGSRTLSLRRAARARAEDAVCFLGQDAPGRSVAAARSVWCWCFRGVPGPAPRPIQCAVQSVAGGLCPHDRQVETPAEGPGGCVDERGRGGPPRAPVVCRLVPAPGFTGVR